MSSTIGAHGPFRSPPLRRALALTNGIVAVGFFALAIHSVGNVADSFIAEPVPRGELILRQMDTFVSPTAQLAILGIAFTAACLGFRNSWRQAWWMQGLAIVLLLLPRGIRLILG
jgi:hypothetical protein